MKQYNYNIHYDVCLQVTAYAETEEEARSLALDRAENIPLSDGECDLRSTEVVSEYDIKEVRCRVQFKDNGAEENVVIGVGCVGSDAPNGYEESIFFWCADMAAFGRLMQPCNGEDFTVIELL